MHLSSNCVDIYQSGTTLLNPQSSICKPQHFFCCKGWCCIVHWLYFVLAMIISKYWEPNKVSIFEPYVKALNKELLEFESLWYLFIHWVGTAVGNEISIQWWPEWNNFMSKKELFWHVLQQCLKFLSCCIWYHLFWDGTDSTTRTCFVTLRSATTAAAEEEQII